MLLWFGLAPWLFCFEVVIYFGLVTLVELERYRWSTTLLVLGLIVTHYFHVFSIVDAIRSHFAITLICILGYFPSGAIWMLFKWLLFLHKFNDARQDALAEFHESQKYARNRAAENSPSYSDEALLRMTDREYLSRNSYKKTLLLRSPNIRDYKAMAIGWVCFWVFSVVGTLFHDIARHISLWIYNRFSGLLQWMSDKVVGEFREPT